MTGYEVLRATGASGGTFTSVGTSATTSFAASGLAPSTTYRFTVRARDAAGNVSTSSGPVSVTTQAGPVTGPCRVTYRAENWGGGSGFTANVTIANTGTTAINGWTLQFTFPGNQRIADGWSARWSQPASSAAVTAANMDYNGTIAPNTSVGIGFNGTYSGTNTAVTTFTVNDIACTTA